MTRQSTLSQQVYDEFLRRLFAGKIVAGQEVNRRALSADFGVSVAPVMEALLRLQNDGLVEVRPRRGTCVRMPTAEQLRGQLILREALECEAAYLYCGGPVKAAYEPLALVARRLEQTDHRTLGHWRDDIQFHRMLMRLADVPAMLEEFDRVMRIDLFSKVNMLSAVDPETSSPGSHDALLKTLGVSNPTRARDAMRRHLREGKPASIFAAPPFGRGFRVAEDGA